MKTNTTLSRLDALLRSLNAIIEEAYEDRESMKQDPQAFVLAVDSVHERMMGVVAEAARTEETI